ncbi:hypothetical protein [Methylobacterium sp. Leaf100]|nr:hypothetical protein [Methylobacterium sp. Leaf100]
MTMLLRKLDSIATLSDEEQEAVRNLPVRIRTLEPRQDIVREGDMPSQCCLVLEGWL